MPHVKIELANIECKDTEDVSGADEFYLVGALVGGEKTQAILTTPISINNGEVKNVKQDEKILFDGNVPNGEVIKGGINAYDEDAGKDWAKYGDTVKDITSVVSAAVATTGPQGVAAATILQVAVTAGGLLTSLDKDDLLGSTQLEISSIGPSMEEVAWKFSKKGMGWSTWDYTVRYRITRS